MNKQRQVAQLKVTLQNLITNALENSKPTTSNQTNMHHINRSFIPSTAKVFTAPWALTLIPLFEHQYQCVAILKTYNNSKTELSFIGGGDQSNQAAKHYHKFIATLNWQKRRFFRDHCSFLTTAEKTNLAKEVIFLQRGIIDSDALFLFIREKSNILSYIKLHSLENGIVNLAYKPLLI